MWRAQSISHSAPYGPPGRHSLWYAAADSSATADRVAFLRAPYGPPGRHSLWYAAADSLVIALRRALRAHTRSGALRGRFDRPLRLDAKNAPYGPPGRHLLWYAQASSAAADRGGLLERSVAAYGRTLALVGLWRR